MIRAKASFFTMLAFFSSAVSLEASAQNLLHKADVRVMGPGGEVLVYYKDGSDIVVRSCGRDYPRVNSRSDCRGAENRIPVAAFKQVLRSEFLIGSADKLKPMTEDELEFFRRADMNGLERLQAQEKVLEDRIARIQEFIDQGAGDQAKEDKIDMERLLVKVRHELRIGKENGAAVKKVNDLINDIVDKIAESKTLFKVADGRDGDQAIFNLLRQFDASKGQCGTDAILSGSHDYNPGNDDQVPGVGGSKTTWLMNLVIPEAKAAGYTTEERIRNCIPLPGSVKKTAAGVIWNLVVRSRDPKTGKFYEVWKDSKSGLIWSDRLDKLYTHKETILFAKNNRKFENACRSEEGKVASAGIVEKKFSLPTIDEFEGAEKNGMREVLPNLKGHFFWSSSIVKSSPELAFGFPGSGPYNASLRSHASSVLCVAR